MGWFDAVGHSFSTVAIGGFSTHDSSLGYFDSAAVDTVAMIFMLIAGVNFALHFTAFRSRSLSAYLQDNEVVVFLLGILFAAVLAIIVLGVYGAFDDAGQLLRQGLFQTVSIATTSSLSPPDSDTRRIPRDPLPGKYTYPSSPHATPSCDM